MTEGNNWRFLSLEKVGGGMACFKICGGGEE